MNRFLDWLWFSTAMDKLILLMFVIGFLAFGVLQCSTARF